MGLCIHDGLRLTTYYHTDGMLHTWDFVCTMGYGWPRTTTQTGCYIHGTLYTRWVTVDHILPQRRDVTYMGLCIHDGLRLATYYRKDGMLHTWDFVYTMGYGWPHTTAKTGCYIHGTWYTRWVTVDHILPQR